MKLTYDQAIAKIKTLKKKNHDLNTKYKKAKHIINYWHAIAVRAACELDRHRNRISSTSPGNLHW